MVKKIYNTVDVSRPVLKRRAAAS